MLHCEAVPGGGAEREQWRHSPLPQITVFHSPTHKQTGPFWCWFPSGWACARPRPLWVSPTTSLVRLGVSPAAAPTPTGIFNQRFEALFPCTRALGWAVCFAPRRRLSVYLCVNVGPRGATRRFACPFSSTLESGPLGLSVGKCGVAGSASGQTACPIRPTLRQSRSRHGNSSPLHPGVLSPPLLPVWMNVYFFISLVSDFLAVQFSVSSGCARRCSVSTYVAILVLSSFHFLP